MQERYDKLYGAKSRIKKKILRELKERRKKSDIKWKIANIVVRTAYVKQYAVVLEKLSKMSVNNMVERIKDRQLRHRIFQASFRGIQKAIEEKARELGVPVVYVDPRSTSKKCPVHNTEIIYGNGSRIGRCGRGGELWHRDVVAVWNLLFRARLGNGSSALSLGGLLVDVSLVPFGSNATHEPTEISKSLWARWNSLPQTQNATVSNRMKR